MSEYADPPFRPIADSMSLEEERSFLLETHRTWKRTQPSPQTHSGQLVEQAKKESEPHEPKDFFQIDQREADFRHQDLRNANFQEAYLPGADFEGADLRGANFTALTYGVPVSTAANSHGRTFPRLILSGRTFTKPNWEARSSTTPPCVGLPSFGHRHKNEFFFDGLFVR